MSTQEVWESIDGFSKYEVSNRGRIKNIRRGKCVSPRTSTCPYLQAGIYDDKGKQHNLVVHRLVAKAFLTNPDNKPCVHHINHVKTDNRVENLKWVTHQENTDAAVEEGVINQKGVNNVRCKTKPWKVKLTRTLVLGGWTQVYTSEVLGLPISRVSDIMNRTWRQTR